MKSLLFAIFLGLTAPGNAASFTGIVAFGDSLTDMGNRSLAPDRPDVKFRQTWVAQLAAPSMLSVSGFKPSGISSFYGGTNYAVGGATTEYTAKLGKDRNRGQNLTQQVSRRYLNPAFNTEGVKPDALHVIVIGTNDLTLASVSMDQLATQWAGMDKVGVAVAQSTESQIQALAAAGVNRVLWGNVFDVARAPAITNRANLLGGESAKMYFAALTKATLAHNAEMDAAIARLTKAHAALRIVKLDLFARFAEVAADPMKFGFVDVSKGGNTPQHLFSADGLHPTSQGHRMLADYAFSVLSSTRLEARPAATAPAVK